MSHRWTGTLKGDVRGRQDMSQIQRSGTATQMTHLSVIAKYAVGSTTSRCTIWRRQDAPIP